MGYDVSRSDYIFRQWIFISQIIGEQLFGIHRFAASQTQCDN